jgi:HAD superfamily hydrolase (TIGR01549 family)
MEVTTPCVVDFMKRSLLTSLAVGASNSNNVMNPIMKHLPILRGVVFDMDGTLTKPNLNFGEMYRRCGVDLSKDILEEIATMPAPQQAEANAIIEEMEEEGRRTLELMPGAQELVHWLSAHQIPMALVTRNTKKSAQVLTDRLLLFNFSIVIPRDEGYPPKPDPTALQAIAKQWELTLPSDGIIMVGDSVSNDIVFGKNAGVRTALLDTGRRYQEEQAGKYKAGNDDASPDIIMDDLGSLPRHLWKQFHIESTLGTSAQNLHGLPSPEPMTGWTEAAACGNLQLLEELLLETGIDINAPDASGNTALIWAAERNQVDMVQRLVSMPGIDLNRLGYLGASAVNRAARRGHVQIVQQLIQAGADLDIPNKKLQYPLHFAAFKQHEDIVKLLLQSGANPRVLDRKGRTPAEDTSNESIRERILQVFV